MERMSSRDRREFLEAKYGKPTPGTFRGANYIPGTQVDAERKQANLMALQGLKNQGLLDVTERQQTGATKRTGLEQVGMTGRLGTTEVGLMSRLGQKLGASRDAERRKALQERLKFYTTPEYDKTGTMLLKAPLDPDTARKMAYGDVDMMYGNQGTENRRQDNIRSFRDDEGYLNFTNEPETINSINTQQKDLSKIPIVSRREGLLQKGMPLAKDQSNLTLPEEQSGSTFEGIYGDGPLTLKDIWAKDEELKRQKDAKRKSQWTVPY